LDYINCRLLSREEYLFNFNVKYLVEYSCPAWDSAQPEISRASAFFLAKPAELTVALRFTILVVFSFANPGEALGKYCPARNCPGRAYFCAFGGYSISCRYSQ
jgi:hypothetical protein